VREHGTVSRYTGGQCSLAMRTYCRDRRDAKALREPVPAAAEVEPRERFIPPGWLIAADYPELVA
jgi:hypothetical protein